MKRDGLLAFSRGLRWRASRSAAILVHWAVGTALVTSGLPQPACAFEPRWSPEVSLALPQPLQVGAGLSCIGEEFICRPELRFYLSGGYFQLPFGSERSLRLSTIESGARYYPFSFPLYLSGGFGYRHVSFSTRMTSFMVEDEQIASFASLGLSTAYFTPSVGASFKVSGSLELGFDLGVQIPFLSGGRLTTDEQLTVTDSETQSAVRSNSSRALDRVASLILPKLTLFRLTWHLN